jgi:hypothetical protein
MTGALIRMTCGPTGKQAYVTLIRADLRRQKLEQQTGIAIRVYRCEHCGLFHLTSHGRRAWRDDG